MTLVNITLTEGEQEVILRNAQSELTFPPEMHEFASLAEKVRRARDTTPWDDEKTYITKTGKVLTGAELNRLSEEAERGYDPASFKPRSGGPVKSPGPVREDKWVAGPDESVSYWDTGVRHPDDGKSRDRQRGT